jgi:hypothetical protein
MAEDDNGRRERRRRFAEMAAMYRDIAPPGLCEIGFLLQDFLENMVADADTAVDKGVGLGSFDLWVTVGGREYYLEIKESLKQAAKDAA